MCLRNKKMIAVIFTFLFFIMNISCDVYATGSSNVDVSTIRDWPMGPEVASQGAVLIEAETGTVLYSKNMNQKFYPASTTKILSTLVAIENSRLDEMVSFSTEAVFSIERGSSNMGMDVGQEITMEQCLYGILVYSANEVANAVAEHVSGDIDSFVGKMNEKAAQLGCVNSHFVTTNGLHDENHYTTPYDLAQIGRAFFANETLAKMSGTRYYKIEPTQKQPDLIELYTHNKLTNKTYPYDGYVGGKTGYTSDANQTLVSCAKRNDMTLICVVMNVDSPGQFTDTIALFDYGFHNFSKVNVAENEKKYTSMNSDFFKKEGQIFGQSEALMSIDPTDTIVLPATIGFDMLQSRLNYVDNPKSPDSVAVIEYSYENVPLGSVNILLAQDQPSYDFESPNVRPDPDSEAERTVVFVNVIKTVLILLCILAGILLLIFLRKYVKEFNFSMFKRRKYMFKDTSKKWTVRVVTKLKENSERRKRRKRYRQRKKF
ncbi:MAG: D-alanyl-D-alanine carboxypeptidase [Lachnospiraceae bacterium]|nr:D-alanyl-D-alanine carboxypeptidase [Lachnospiraceae bacterium]